MSDCLLISKQCIFRHMLDNLSFDLKVFMVYHFLFWKGQIKGHDFVVAEQKESSWHAVSFAIKHESVYCGHGQCSGGALV